MSKIPPWSSRIGTTKKSSSKLAAFKCLKVTITLKSKRLRIRASTLIIVQLRDWILTHLRSQRRNLSRSLLRSRKLPSCHGMRNKSYGHRKKGKIFKGNRRKNKKRNKSLWLLSLLYWTGGKRKRYWRGGTRDPRIRDSSRGTWVRKRNRRYSRDSQCNKSSRYSLRNLLLFCRRRSLRNNFSRLRSSLWRSHPKWLINRLKKFRYL